MLWIIQNLECLFLFIDEYDVIKIRWFVEYLLLQKIEQNGHFTIQFGGGKINSKLEDNLEHIYTVISNITMI